MFDGKERRRKKKKKEEKYKVEIFAFDFLDYEENSWDSGVIFYIMS